MSGRGQTVSIGSVFVRLLVGALNGPNLAGYLIQACFPEHALLYQKHSNKMLLVDPATNYYDERNNFHRRPRYSARHRPSEAQNSRDAYVVTRQAEEVFYNRKMRWESQN